MFVWKILILLDRTQKGVLNPYLEEKPGWGLTKNFCAVY